MKSYLSLIPISAKVHRRENRMTRLCIIFSVFMVTAVFSMAEMGARMEQSRLLEKHGSLLSFQAIFESGMGQSIDGNVFIFIDFGGWGADDFGKYQQQRSSENEVFWNDALHWNEQTADHPFCEAGSIKLV